MNAQEQDRTAALLRQALPPVESEAEPARDLWPVVLRRLNRRAAPAHSHWIWFDCALLAGLAGIAVVFPSAIPVLLYYL